jgi:aspartyl-tRNA(Asn)/glutamyl-tRNA(Gln) amidotransferase subunit A
VTGDVPLALRSVAEVAAAVRDRVLSPVELLDAQLARIHAVEPLIGAYVHLDIESATAAARASAEAVLAGTELGPLHGVPLSVKDVLYHGPTRAGSLVPLPPGPPGGSAAVANLQAAGGIILGKAATYEFALGAQWVEGPFTPTRNPWRTDLDAGGSSSGSVASVAAGLAFGSLGTDTAGSVRYPASCCGVVGLKPTFGRIPTRGLVVLSYSFDHIGPVARTVLDAALLFDAARGNAGRPVAPEAREGARSDLCGRRIGVPRRLFEEGCAPEVAAAFEGACDLLRELGAEVRDVPLEVDMELVSAALWPILLSEGAAAHEDAVWDPASPIGPQMRTSLDAGLLLSAVDYVRAQRLRQVVVDRVARILDDVDLLALPTTSALVGPVPTAPSASDQYATGKNQSVFTALANLTGQPAITLPFALHDTGVPLGLQLLAPTDADGPLLRAAASVEAALDWYPRYLDLPHHVEP